MIPTMKRKSSRIIITFIISSKAIEIAYIAILRF
jgi:hypothetical protein